MFSFGDVPELCCAPCGVRGEVPCEKFTHRLTVLAGLSELSDVAYDLFATNPVGQRRADLAGCLRILDERLRVRAGRNAELVCVRDRV